MGNGTNAGRDGRGAFVSERRNFESLLRTVFVIVICSLQSASSFGNIFPIQKGNDEDSKYMNSFTESSGS